MFNAKIQRGYERQTEGKQAMETMKTQKRRLAKRAQKTEGWKKGDKRKGEMERECQSNGHIFTQTGSNQVKNKSLTDKEKYLAFLKNMWVKHNYKYTITKFGEKQLHCNVKQEEKYSIYCGCL